MESSRKATPPSRIVIEATKNGGHVVEHHFDNTGRGESYRPSEKHAFGDHASMIAHVQRHTAGMAGLPEDDRAVGIQEGNEGGERRTGVGRPITRQAPNQRSYGAGVD